MSIEKDLSRIAAALENIATAMSARSVSIADVYTTRLNTPAPVAAPAPAVAAPALVGTAPDPVVAAPAPVVAAPVVAAPAPVVAAPAPVVAAPTSGKPFNDMKGLLSYIMGRYQALGPIKGGQIQEVLLSFGCNSVSDIKPEHYDALYEKIEALA